MKLIINSHISFEVALKKLIKSIKSSGFDMWDNIVVVRGGCSTSSTPYKARNMYNIYHVDMLENFYDHNGHCLLARMGDHPVLEDKCYMYIHDTCTVDYSFKEKFIAMEKFLGEHKDAMHASPPCHASNICVFKKEFIKFWGKDFEFYGKAKKDSNGALSINKSIALKYECHLIDKPGTFFLQQRERYTIQDIYRTGLPRHGYRYPDFGLTKWILIGGDSTGNGGDFSQNKLTKNNTKAPVKNNIENSQEKAAPKSAKNTIPIKNHRYNNIAKRR